LLLYLCTIGNALYKLESNVELPAQSAYNVRLKRYVFPEINSYVNSPPNIWLALLESTKEKIENNITINFFIYKNLDDISPYNVC
jgi:hypothetical protein